MTDLKHRKKEDPIMIDPELEAIHKCTELLRELDDEAKIRVIQYLVNRYKLAANQSGAPIYTGGPAQPASATPAIIHLPGNGYSQGEIQNAQSVEGVIALKDIVAKDLPKSEPEWVLIYCYFASEFGKKPFTRDDIFTQYENSKRSTDQRKSNLTLNLNSVVKKDWVKSLNDKEYILLEEGKKYTDEILHGKSVTKPRKVPKRIKKDASATSTSDDE